MNLFDSGKKPLKIDKPIRLVELFAGIGSQAKALERLGADFEHYRTSEWEISAVASYKAIHKHEDDTDYSKPYSNEELLDILCNLGISTDGKKPMTRQQISRKNEKWKRTVYNNFKATNNVGSIVNISATDLGIVNTDKYYYILCYSFPCQDLSIAGRQLGMAKGSNTRSGLLWEVERLLNECEELPQVLLMENVTQVHGKKNMEHFQEWMDFLESKGYSNYWKDLNAKNFGIPQNRNRTFMVSVLGDYTYEFPQELPLQLRLKDMLEDSVDEKYYLSNKGIEYILKRDGKYTQVCDDSTEIAKAAITAVGNANWTGNFVAVEPRVIGGVGEKESNGGTQWYQQDRIFDNELAISVTTGFLPCYKTEEPIPLDYRYDEGVRIRKLIPLECWRLMDFDDADFEKAAQFNSNSQLYKQAGNSIVVDVLYYIFKGMM